MKNIYTTDGTGIPYESPQTSVITFEIEDMICGSRAEFGHEGYRPGESYDF